MGKKSETFEHEPRNLNTIPDNKLSKSFKYKKLVNK